MGNVLSRQAHEREEGTHLSDLEKVGEAEEQRVRGLISCPRASWDDAIWSDDIEDPEFKKNLRILARLIAEALALRARLDLRDADSGQQEELVSRIAELRRRLVLPDDVPLTLPTLLGHRFDLELLLVDLGDETYIRTRAAELYAEPEGTIISWQQMYEKQKPPLLVDGTKASETAEARADGTKASETARARADRLSSTRMMVKQLLAAKEGQDRLARARRELKTRILVETVLPGILVAAIVLAAVLVQYRVILWETLAPVLAASVAGAALGQFMKLRDEVSRGAQVREFVPLFFGQAMVGFLTGLFVAMAAAQLSILKLDDPKAMPALAFAAGFSEAAFVGLISKISGDSGVKPLGPADRSSSDK
jgi:hypothetical protein